MISAEKYMPYMRPPLSKDVWYTDDDAVVQRHAFKQWNGQEKTFDFLRFSSFVNSSLFSLYFVDEEFYTDPKTLNEQENGGVAVVLGRKVTCKDGVSERVERVSLGRRSGLEKLRGEIGQWLGDLLREMSDRHGWAAEEFEDLPDSDHTSEEQSDSVPRREFTVFLNLSGALAFSPLPSPFFSPSNLFFSLSHSRPPRVESLRRGKRRKLTDEPFEVFVPQR